MKFFPMVSEFCSFNSMFFTTSYFAVVTLFTAKTETLLFAPSQPASFSALLFQCVLMLSASNREDFSLCDFSEFCTCHISPRIWLNNLWSCLCSVAFLSL